MHSLSKKIGIRCAGYLHSNRICLKQPFNWSQGLNFRPKLANTIDDHYQPLKVHAILMTQIRLDTHIVSLPQLSGLVRMVKPQNRGLPQLQKVPYIHTTVTSNPKQSTPTPTPPTDPERVSLAPLFHCG